MKKLAAAALTLPLVSGCAAAATTTSTTPAGSMTSSSPAHHPSTRHTSTPLTVPLDRTRHSLTDPKSIWVIVNKRHPISPLDFHPQITLVRGYQVATSAAAPLAHLLNAADEADVPLKIASAFRSLDYQQSVHSRLVATMGPGAADAISARPGYSEHQTGLAVDLEPLSGTCTLQPCFAHTTAGRWLAAHAWKFGFVIRYTKANRKITGYSPEPWHYRYVGTALARALRHTRTSSLEQFFGVVGGNYATGASH